MNLWKSLHGMVQVEITSADPGTFLEILNTRGIVLFHIKTIDMLTVRCVVLRSDLKKTSDLCIKYGNTMHIRDKKGIYWRAGKLFCRPVLVFGLVLFVFLISVIPTRVLFLEVEGNCTIPDHQILEAAEKCGIRFGASRRAVRSEKIKNALLSELPQLQWAGINTSGCRAVISVKEREQLPRQEFVPGITQMIAVADGMITSCTVTRGNAVCSVGQTVKKDQLLISPYVDCGLAIKVVPVDGEIYAQTNRKVMAVTPSKMTFTEDIGKNKHRFYLIIGKKRINLWKDSGISDTTCGRMYEEYYITLPGGFQLPICLGIETIYSRNLSVMEVSQDTSQHMLTDFAENYLCGQMIGGTILEQNCIIKNTADNWMLDGEYVCHEMIGRITAERNGEMNE